VDLRALSLWLSSNKMLFQRFLDWLHRCFASGRKADATFASGGQRLDASSMYTEGNDHAFGRASGATGGADMPTAALTEDLRLPPASDMVHDQRIHVSLCPDSLSKRADDYDVHQLRLANEQYDAFLATEYERFLAWISYLLKQDAEHGGRLLSVTFDHSTSKVEASGTGLIRAYGDRYLFGEFRYFGLPFCTSLTCFDLLVERLAASTADYFRALMFYVLVNMQKPTYSRRRSTPRITTVSVFWMATPSMPVGTDEPDSTTMDSSLSDMETFDSLSIVHREPSYQPKPLIEYDPILQEKAFELFHYVEQRLGKTKAKAYKGSYSILTSKGAQTVAKIIIYEIGLGRMNGDWPSLPGGVYVLIRANGLAGDRIWRDVPQIADIVDRARTMGIAPRHSERFAYFMLSDDDDAEQIADLILKCARVLRSE
jgi:hypothetical protein